jgi:hypothetical protein
VPLRVPTALSPDLTMLVPQERVFSPAEASCRDLDAIVPRLREAAVDTVVAVVPLVHRDLEPAGVLAPARIAPLAVHLHRLRGPRPRAEAGGARVLEASYAANSASLLVDASRPTELVLRDGWAPGWTARVDGAPAAVLRAAGGHRSLRLPPGRHRVLMQYRPHGLVPALGASALALAAAAALAAAGRRRQPRPASGSVRPPGRSRGPADDRG